MSEVKMVNGSELLMECTCHLLDDADEGWTCYYCYMKEDL
jgi:hypothetical protein